MATIENWAGQIMFWASAGLALLCIIAFLDSIKRFVSRFRATTKLDRTFWKESAGDITDIIVMPAVTAMIVAAIIAAIT